VGNGNCFIPEGGEVLEGNFDLSYGQRVGMGMKKNQTNKQTKIINLCACRHGMSFGFLANTCGFFIESSG